MTTLSTPIYCDPTRRHDFAFLFDVTNGNPNGDPDAGNLPRIDPETMRGLVTDVCIKRKIRDWVDMTAEQKAGFAIYVQNKGIALNDFNKRAHEAVFGAASENEPGGTVLEEKEGKRPKATKVGDQGKESRDRRVDESLASRQHARRDWMCKQFYDIRTFGAVLSTGDYPAGQVRGPIQLTFAQSVDRIVPQDISITRVAVTEMNPQKKTTSTMGRKAFVPYGLYLGYGFVVPHFAQQTGFSSEDLEVFWTALQSVWDIDRSANRGMLALRGLIIFSHRNALGNAPAHRLFDRIHVKLAEDVQIPRHINDYAITVNEMDLPEEVTLTRLV
ncbi:type I-C CRISPR-associated protein Cas7/Csd2 [Dictyobacter aurantiacus]|uniref:Type I-C CRISPR-associated protein Cas7/Csd2 n=1 Tax=Dictyobacter aurantiacus TaxID=1936993 RepID=A0A401ZGX6_9CHLR|nr:type I-C CRISPR-associated protein Cas7/Csd2 [Dictyobacter aurantiacus]GCE06141.1 type I-C CRISPR-associated protein Cas7/Csd2 [Dictyobacter aurantiacus]